MKLGYTEFIELLGYSDSERHPLEIFGFEQSEQGRSAYSRVRSGTEQMLLSFILRDIEQTGFFPGSFREKRPEAYCDYIEEGSCLVSVDTPNVWTKSWYATAEIAARALIRKRLDAEWIEAADEELQPVKVETSW